MSDMLADHFEKSLFKTPCNTHLLHTHHIGIACSKYIMLNNQIWSPWSKVQVVLKNEKKSSVKRILIIKEHQNHAYYDSYPHKISSPNIIAYLLLIMHK